EPLGACPGRSERETKSRVCFTHPAPSERPGRAGRPAGGGEGSQQSPARVSVSVRRGPPEEWVAVPPPSPPRPPQLQEEPGWMRRCPGSPAAFPFFALPLW
ncbi:hypothetical protein KIL84_009903, partial [Mauremys mutica]